MLFIAGLGNPGADYARNRHNIGFMAVDAIADRYDFGPERARFRSLTREGQIAGERILILKPQTFMNRSGEALGEALRFYKADSDAVLVIYDEIDLPLGRLKLKLGGGHAGHNGIRSIIDHLGPDFRRLRIGVGHPGDRDKVHKHVLSNFGGAEWESVQGLIDAIAANGEALLRNDGSAFMSGVEGRLPDVPKIESE